MTSALSPGHLCSKPLRLSSSPGAVVGEHRQERSVLGQGVPIIASKSGILRQRFIKPGAAAMLGTILRHALIKPVVPLLGKAKLLSTSGRQLANSTWSSHVDQCASG